MQVYKEIKILSARPSNYQGVRHHLYGFLSVKKKFSTGEWIQLAEKKINDITKRKKIPIFVGGTGLYFKTLTDGIAKVPQISALKRKEVINLYNKIGSEKFYNKLIKLDPKCKNRIEKNDKQRMIRFYEVKYFTKKSIFDWQKNTINNLRDYYFVKIFLNPSRSFLLEKIQLRFKKMIVSGALKEVRRFQKLKVSKQSTANHILGLNELMN